MHLFILRRESGIKTEKHIQPVAESLAMQAALGIYRPKSSEEKTYKQMNLKKEKKQT